MPWRPTSRCVGLGLLPLTVKLGPYLDACATKMHTLSNGLHHLLHKVPHEVCIPTVSWQAAGLEHAAGAGDCGIGA